MVSEIVQTGHQLMIGLMDTDNDGVGDNSDAFPNNPSQQTDTDGDGYGDNKFGTQGDKFLRMKLSGLIQTVMDMGIMTNWVQQVPMHAQTNLVVQPWIDWDVKILMAMDIQIQEMVKKPILLELQMHSISSQHIFDSDGDGYGDNLTGYRGDACPTLAGTSTRANMYDPGTNSYTSISRYGCVDEDGDGYDDNTESTYGDCSMANNRSEWLDEDRDCLGSNADLR